MKGSSNSVQPVTSLLEGKGEGWGRRPLTSWPSDRLTSVALVGPEEVCVCLCVCGWRWGVCNNTKEMNMKYLSHV